MTDAQTAGEQTAAAKLQAAAEALDLAIARNRIRGVGIELAIARSRVAEAREALAPTG